MKSATETINKLIKASARLRRGDPLRKQMKQDIARLCWLNYMSRVEELLSDRRGISYEDTCTYRDAMLRQYQRHFRAQDVKAYRQAL